MREPRVRDIPLQWIASARRGGRGDVRAQDSSMVRLEIAEIRWRPVDTCGMTRSREVLDRVSSKDGFGGFGNDGSVVSGIGVGDEGTVGIVEASVS